MMAVGMPPGARLRVSGAITTRLGSFQAPTWTGSKRVGEWDMELELGSWDNFRV